MCGLAGFARNPKGDQAEVVKLLSVDLIEAMEKRGRDATGIAVIGGARPFICKTAVRASLALASDAWSEPLSRIGGDTRIVIGHTRAAYVPGRAKSNASDDEAAHPFRVGGVIGAHNGVIYNWEEVQKQLRVTDRWTNDSQAAFGALNHFNDPQDALELLKGYWALTWTKGNRLFMTTNGAPLAVAYVPGLQALLWASKRVELVKALRSAKVGRFFDSEVEEGAVVAYDTSEFDDKGSHAMIRKLSKIKAHRTKQAVTVTSGHGGESSGITTYAREALSQQLPLLRGLPEEPAVQSLWGTREPTNSELAAALTSAWRTIRRIDAELDEVKGECEALRAETEHMLAVLDDHGLLGYDDRRLPPERDLPDEVPVCRVCGGGSEPGNPLLGEGKGESLTFIHDGCVRAALDEPKIAVAQ